MKAVVFKGPFEVEVEDRPTPQPEEGEILIRVEYAGICGSDMHPYRGDSQLNNLNLIMGHELVGIVEKINSKQENLGYQVGDRVVPNPYTSCGVCEMCLTGRHSGCETVGCMGFVRDGCFAQYMKIGASEAYRIDPSVDPKTAALTEPLTIAMHDVRESGIKAGQTAFIIGGGPIGVLEAMVCRLGGASLIAISETNEARCRFLRGLGFTVFNPLNTDVIAECGRMTGGLGFDVVFEVSGSQAGYELMTTKGVIKNGGRIMIVALPSRPLPVDGNAIARRHYTITGVNLADKINFKAAVHLVNSQKINDELAKLVTDIYPLDQAKEAFDFQDKDQDHFKVLFDCT